jgi:hypothetical protein
MTQSLGIVSSSMVKTINADAAKAHDDLKLPSGRRVGDCAHEQLAAELDRLKIENFSHSLSRRACIELYAETIAAVAKAGADAAVISWLQEHRS